MTKDTREAGGCGREELLVTVLYGEASEREREEFASHRAACAACDEEFAAFSAVRGELRSWETGPVPRIRVEVRPGLVERIRRSFAILPVAARVAAAGASALLVLALFNAEVAVGPDGAVRFSASLLPRPEAAATEVAGTGGAPAAEVALSREQVERMIAERTDQAVRAQLASYRTELAADLEGLERQLVAGGQSEDVRRLAVQVKAQRRKIDQLERDLDRTAGYGGADLFSVVLSGQEAGN